MVLSEILIFILKKCCENVDCIYLVQDRDKLRAGLMAFHKSRNM
jgi:hypothetical protein